MTELSSYSRTLTKALNALNRGDYSTAEYAVNNFYHATRRTAADYMTLLRLTAHHRAFLKATDECRNQLAQILFQLDRRYNQPSSPVFVHMTSSQVAGARVLRFRIVEKESDAAH